MRQRTHRISLWYFSARAVINRSLHGFTWDRCILLWINKAIQSLATSWQSIMLPFCHSGSQLKNTLPSALLLHHHFCNDSSQMTLKIIMPGKCDKAENINIASGGITPQTVTQENQLQKREKMITIGNHIRTKEVRMWLGQRNNAK